MASFEFDNVKAEKEDALWKYNMERKLMIGLRLIGFLFVSFLLLCSSFPTLILDAVEVAGDLRRRFVSAFNKPLFTFIVVNIIIVAVYVLSSQKKTQKRSTSSDIYDEYVTSRRSISKFPVTEMSTVEKQIVLVENAVDVSPVKQHRTVVNTVTETKISPSTVEQHKTIRKVAKTKPKGSSTELVEPKQYRRTRSMVSESRVHEQHREFRRSETAVGLGIEAPRISMEEMSSEEFQLIIDSFIAEKKKTLMQENNAHYY